MNQQEMLERVRDMAPADQSLYYSQEDPALYWGRLAACGVLQDDIAAIRSEGSRFAGQPVPELSYRLFSLFQRTGSRLEYEKVYFERRRRLNTYVLLALLEPENPQHLDHLQDILWSVCGEYTWCLPAHLPPDCGVRGIHRFIDLFSAETGFALSEVSLLLGDRLPPLLKSRMREEVERRILQPFLEAGPYEWENARHNWSAVCAGSIGAAALLTVDEPVRLAAILLKTQNSMRCYLEGFGNDGVCLEGLGYWNYGFGYFACYSDLLRARSRGKLDWFQLDKVRTIARFQQKCFIGGDLIANFSDSVPRMRVQRGLSHYLAAVYPDVERPPSALYAAYTEDHCSRFAPALRNFLWTKPGTESPDWQAASWYLPDAAWMVSRHESDEGVFGFAAKGGHNGEPHNHNDLGHFILLGCGDIYAADLGSGEYTADYFSAGRYAYDCNGSQGHSVPIIEGQYQLEGQEHAAAVLGAGASKSVDELTLELSRAYGMGSLKSLVRSLIWHKEELPRLELTDEYRFDGTPNSWTERFVTLSRPEIMQPGVTVLRGAKGGGIKVFYDSQSVQPEIAAHVYRNHFGEETAWHSLDFHALRLCPEGRFIFNFQFFI